MSVSVPTVTFWAVLQWECCNEYHRMEWPPLYIRHHRDRDNIGWVRVSQVGDTDLRVLDYLVSVIIWAERLISPAGYEASLGIDWVCMCIWLCMSVCLYVYLSGWESVHVWAWVYVGDSVWFYSSISSLLTPLIDACVYQELSVTY